MRAALLEALAAGGGRVLYETDGEKLRYDEALDQVQRLAAALARQGTGPVVVYGHKSVGQLVSILACVVAGRCYVPLDTYLPQARLAEIVRQSEAELILANAFLALDAPCARLTPRGLMAAYREGAPLANDNRICYTIFTSGSTGKSKGVPISYDNLAHFIRWITTVPPLAGEGGHRLLSVSSFSFDLSVMDLYYAIFTQSTIVAPGYGVREEMARLFDEMAETAVDFIVLTPTLAKLLLLDADFDAAALPAVRWFFFCGEVLEVATARKLAWRFPDARIINAYGPTECTCCVSLAEITPELLALPTLPVGRIETAAVDIALEDDEIILCGASVFEGYLGVATDACFESRGRRCFATSDIGATEDGWLYCLGRKDDLVKYQGYRIALGDIEHNLLAIPGVGEAVAIAQRREGVVRKLKAFVVLGDHALTEADLKAQLAKLLPAYMVPRCIIIMETLPVNANGKYDRKRLESL
ncbi:MAG: AMP-binding protein [Peptococcaceae bacterium]|nr:AMP-binding protein [Peptococcaceae bacterium]